MILAATRKQYLIHVDFSSDAMALNDDKWQAIKDIVARRVSQVVGGCTMIDTQGYWADIPDNHANKGDYSHYQVFREVYGAQLQVKCEENGLEALKKSILNGFKLAADEYPEARLEWMCGAVQEVSSFNFNVKG